MKKIILMMALVFGLSNLYAQSSEGIEFFHGSWAEVKTLAKKENKIIFMDCYTTWCGPCKMLAKKVFTQKEVGDFFNKNFVNVKMDMESEVGKPLKGEYNVSVFPTLLWLDADGNIQHKSVGSCDAKALLATAKAAVDSENSWTALNKKFEAGERSVAFLQKFILVSSKARLDTKAAAEAYYSIKKPEQLINTEDMELIASTVKSVSDSKFRFVLKNKAKFYAVSEKAKVDQFIEQTMSVELKMVMRKGDESAIAAKKEELLSLDKVIASKIVAFNELGMLFRNPDRVKFYQALVNYSIKYEFENSDKLNKYAGMLAKEEISKDLMDKVLKMAKRSVELDANFANVDTYACLLDKAGLKEEAKIQAKKSIELAPEEQKKDLWSAAFIADN